MTGPWTVYDQGNAITEPLSEEDARSQLSTDDEGTQFAMNAVGDYIYRHNSPITIGRQTPL